jgi:hypothetical protein
LLLGHTVTKTLQLERRDAATFQIADYFLLRHSMGTLIGYVLDDALI